MSDSDEFLDKTATHNEIRDDVSKLNSRKVPSLDCMMTEHFKQGEDGVVKFLFLVLSWIIRFEYIPRQFKEGIENSLHKSKSMSTTNPENFRKINLLSTYSRNLLNSHMVKDWELVDQQCYPSTRCWE